MRRTLISREQDRRYEICPPTKIEAWFRFDFPGREREGMKYSKMRWQAEHFNGTDWDHRSRKNAIYKLIDDPATTPYQQPPRRPAVSSPLRTRLPLLSKFSSGSRNQMSPKPSPRRPGKGWADDVDDQNGNNDYLMFSNIDYAHSEVREEVKDWGHWMIEDVGVNGFRLDAAQHISYSLTKEWIRKVNESSLSRQEEGENVFVVGEVWTGDVRRILKWLNAVQCDDWRQVYAYDAPLIYNFSRVSEDVRVPARRKNIDLRTIARDSLLSHRPEASVTFVTNHDTQPGQTSYTPMLAQLKLLFYAFILLRQEGLPCVFWGDVFGTKGPHAEPPACLARNENGTKRSVLADLMVCRKSFAYGEQMTYADAATCIGWTRAGIRDRPGCAVVMSIAGAGKIARKKMMVGRKDEIWINILGVGQNKVRIDGNGYGIFPCRGTGVSVFVWNDAEAVKHFPVKFNLDVYDS